MPHELANDLRLSPEPLAYRHPTKVIPTTDPPATLGPWAGGRMKGHLF